MIVVSEAMLSRFFEVLIPFWSSSKCIQNDSSLNLSLSGGGEREVNEESLNKLFDTLNQLEILGFVRLEINGETINDENYNEEFALYNDSSSWKLSINKRDLFKDKDGVLVVFYLSFENFRTDFARVSLTGYDTDLCSSEGVKILIPKIERPIKGAKVVVTCPAFLNAPFIESDLPDSSSLKKNVKWETDTTPLLDCKLFDFCLNDTQSAGNEFLRSFAVQLLVSISNKIVGDINVVLEGNTAREFLISNNKEIVSEEKLFNIHELIIWTYAADYSTRQRLVVDHALLNTYENESLLSVFLRQNDQILELVKHQYSFIVKERRAEYTNDLTRLMGQLDKQREFYQNKIRSVLFAFLRDLIVCLFLFGLTLPAKVIFTEKEKLELYLNGISTLKILAGVLLVSSCFLQLVITVPYVIQAQKSLKLWLKETRSEMQIAKYQTVFEEPLKVETNYFWGQLSLVAVCYLALAVILQTNMII